MILFVWMPAFVCDVVCLCVLRSVSKICVVLFCLCLRCELLCDVCLFVCMCVWMCFVVMFFLFVLFVMYYVVLFGLYFCVCCRCLCAFVFNVFVRFACDV